MLPKRCVDLDVTVAVSSLRSLDLANKLAEKVRSSGRPVEMDPMSPGERRVVHVALAEQADLETRSEGEGIYRHLVIFPKKA